jgi:dUTPase
VLELRLKLAQLVLPKHENAIFRVVEELDETERDKGKIGSTGMRAC